MDLIEKRHLECPPEREVLKGFEPNEDRWAIEAAGSRMSTPGAKHSSKGLVHDKMFGGTNCYKHRIWYFLFLSIFILSLMANFLFSIRFSALLNRNKGASEEQKG